MIRKPSSSGLAGHSADVRIDLHTNGSVLPVGQMGGGRIILRDEAVLHHDHGVVVMSIDGDEHRWEASFDPCSTPKSVIDVQLRPLPEH